MDRRVLRGDLAEARFWRDTFVDARARCGRRQIATYYMTPLQRPRLPRNAWPAT
jgi:hypothetical protein